MADVSEPPKVEAPISWWIWCGWIEKGTDRTFIYGCAARAYRAAGWNGKDVRLDLPGGGSLAVCQKTVSAEDFETFCSTLDQGSVNLASLIRLPIPEAAVHASRQVIQSALGHGAARAHCYCTFPDLEQLLASNPDAWKVVLSTLQTQLSLPFQADYAGRIGNFEIFNLQSWLDRPTPFLLEVVPDRTNPADLGPRTLRICRENNFAKEPHIAHVVGRADNDVLFDRIVMLKAGEERSAPLDCAEPLVDFDFRLFDITGEHLLHFEHHVFMRSVNFALAPVHRRYVIKDDLTVSATGKSPALARAAETVVGYSSVRSAVQFGQDGPWRRYSDDMRERATSLFVEPSEDKWFSRGIASEVSVIQHFNSLLDGSQVREAVLVDAWFGEDALRRFALRLGSQDVKFTIVTSWTTTDPDTGHRLGASNPTEKLERALTELQQLINPQLSVLNLADGSERAFHDRYLLLYPHQATAKVYLLSNSINKMAGKWPFCMSVLQPDAAYQARAYIEGLCRGQDISGRTSPTTTFRWPSNAT
jgi:hypothetical protein